MYKASLLTGMRFNAIDMGAYTCTSTCENHAGGVVTMHYVVFHGQVFNTTKMVFFVHVYVDKKL